MSIDLLKIYSKRFSSVNWNDWKLNTGGRLAPRNPRPKRTEVPGDPTIVDAEPGLPPCPYEGGWIKDSTPFEDYMKLAEEKYGDRLDISVKGSYAWLGDCDIIPNDCWSHDRFYYSDLRIRPKSWGKNGRFVYGRLYVHKATRLAYVELYNGCPSSIPDYRDWDHYESWEQLKNGPLKYGVDSKPLPDGLKQDLIDLGLPTGDEKEQEETGGHGKKGNKTWKVNLHKDDPKCPWGGNWNDVERNSEGRLMPRNPRPKRTEVPGDPTIVDAEPGLPPCPYKETLCEYDDYEDYMNMSDKSRTLGFVNLLHGTYAWLGDCDIITNDCWFHDESWYTVVRVRPKSWGADGPFVYGQLCCHIPSKLPYVAFCDAGPSRVHAKILWDNLLDWETVKRYIPRATGNVGGTEIVPDGLTQDLIDLGLPTGYEEEEK